MCVLLCSGFNCIAVSQENSLSAIDLIICVGGDGTLLYTSSLFQVLHVGDHHRPYGQYQTVHCSHGQPPYTLYPTFLLFPPSTSHTHMHTHSLPEQEHCCCQFGENADCKLNVNII